MLCHNCQKETKNPIFCSRSCSAIFNNRGKRRHGQARPKCAMCDNLTAAYHTRCCSSLCDVNYKWDLIQNKILTNTGQITNFNLRKYLLLTNPTCEECKISSHYNGKPITLEMDHMDGDSSNIRLNNVRLLCPNCHSQTSTYKAKNSKNPNGAEKRKKRYLRQIKHNLAR